MKLLKCSYLVKKKCNFVAKAETIDDLKKHMWQHLEENHKEFLAPLSDKQMDNLDRKMERLVETN